MARPPLPIGERGAIKRTEQADGSWEALCRYRDMDGVTRRVKAVGASGQKAENALKKKLKNRPQGEEITSETRLAVAAERWFETVLADPERSSGTKDAYRNTLDRHIIPGVGSLRLWEATTARLDGYIRKLSTPHNGLGGPTAARQARSILSLILGMCARYGAISANPVRDTIRPKSTKNPIRVMEPAEFQDFYAHITGWLSGGRYGPKRNKAILDVIDLLIATGCRPGEVLAFQYADVDFKAGTLKVTGTIKRTKADGLHRQEATKTKSTPTLTLPSFALSILRRRKLASTSEFVFPNRLGGVWEPSNVSRIWREARGEEWQWVQPRSFRRIVATMIDRESGSLAAARQLGHTTDANTKLYYIATDETPIDSREVLERFRGTFMGTEMASTGE